MYDRLLLIASQRKSEYFVVKCEILKIFFNLNPSLKETVVQQ